MPLLLRNIRKGKRRALITELNSIARKEIEKALDSDVKPALIKSHNLVVADWKNKPEFRTRKVIRPDKITMTVFPAGDNADIYTYVDQGTKAHMIPAGGGRIYAKKAKALSFKYGGKYNPKTLAGPARTAPGGGRVVGGTPVVVGSVKGHMVSGIKAREFSKTIAGDIEPGFNKTITDAFKRVSRQLEE